MAYEYIAKRHGLKVGDEIIPVGEVVPGAASFLTLRELVDGGLVEARWVPDPPLDSNATTAQETQEGLQEAGGTESTPASGEGQDGPHSAQPGSLSIDLAKMNQEQVAEYALEHLDQVPAIIAAEEQGRRRKALLAQLRTLTEGE